MNYNSLAKEAHETAKEKGFYKSTPSLVQRTNLIISEISEALESDREGKWFPPCNEVWDIERLEGSHYFELYTVLLKPAFEAEIADILIRVLDLSAFLGDDIDGDLEAYRLANGHFNMGEDLQFHLFKLTDIAVDIPDNCDNPIIRMVAYLEDFAKAFIDCDLLSIVKGKMRYNALRSSMNGGKNY